MGRGREGEREEGGRRGNEEGTQLLTALSGFWKSIFRRFIALRMATIDCTVLL